MGALTTCATSPLVVKLNTIKSDQKKHPDWPLVHFVQLHSITPRKKSGRNELQTKCPNVLRCCWWFFSVDGAYDTISGWETPYIHVGGERTTSFVCLRLPAQRLHCVATKYLSLVRETLTLAEHWKGEDCSDPNGATRSWKKKKKLLLLPLSFVSALQQAAQPLYVVRQSTSHRLPYASCANCCLKTSRDLFSNKTHQNQSKTRRQAVKQAS